MKELQQKNPSELSQLSNVAYPGLVLFFYLGGGQLTWDLANWASENEKFLAQQEKSTGTCRDDRMAHFLALYWQLLQSSICRGLHVVVIFVVLNP